MMSLRLPPIITKADDDTDGLLDLPDIRQEDDYSCWAAQAMSVGQFFGVGPDTLPKWKKLLGTNPETSTSFDKVVEVLTDLGLSAEPREGMTIDDLAEAVENGQPVLCAVREYETARDKKAKFDYGHCLAVIGVHFGYVFVQDSSEENALEGQDSLSSDGRDMIAEDVWMDHWHDTDEDGKEYKQFGIVVGPGEEVGAKAFRAPVKIGTTRGTAARFDEGKHRRAGKGPGGGRFTSGGGGGKSPASGHHQMPKRTGPPPLPGEKKPPAPGSGPPPKNLGRPTNKKEATEHMLWLVGHASMLRRKARGGTPLTKRESRNLVLAQNLASRIRYQHFTNHGEDEAGKPKAPPLKLPEPKRKPVARPNADLDAAMSEPMAKKKKPVRSELRHNPDLDEAFKMFTLPQVTKAMPGGHKWSVGNTGHPVIDSAWHAAKSPHERAHAVHESAKHFADLHLAGHLDAREAVSAHMKEAFKGEKPSRETESLVQRAHERIDEHIRANQIGHPDQTRTAARGRLARAGFKPVDVIIHGAHVSRG